MKAKFVEQGASRYITGDVIQFDQKNEMFCRPLWDETKLDLGKKFYMTEAPPKDKPGYRLHDQALVNAAWHLENTFGQGVAGGRMGMYAWEWDRIYEYPMVPPGLKIDLNDPAGVTANLKRAATFFGASLVGVCKLDRRWIYSSAFPLRDQKSTPNELPEEYQYAVALAISGDRLAFKNFIDRNPFVFPLKGGIRVHLEGASTHGKVKIRPEGVEIAVWTVMEAIR